MHAGTEQLLILRDGGPVDADIAQHVTGCAQCRDDLARLRQIRDELRQLPQMNPPAAVWQEIETRLGQGSARRYGWLRGAAAAAVALIALAVWQTGSRDAGVTETAQLGNGDTEVSDDPVTASLAERSATDPADLDALVSQSRRLEQLLREINSSTPRVMNAGMAGTIADLQDGIAYIDYGLSYDEQLDQAQSEQLWRQRVGLMNTLVQVRGAQLQQISN